MKRVLVLPVVLLTFATCATTDEAGRDTGSRTVVITMRDNHYEPDRLDVRRGETLDLRFVNRGKNRHDAFIGDDDAQRRHEQEAREAGDDAGHDGGHEAEADAITVEPGDTGTLTYRFDERGEVLIGCHEPGHYADGMTVTISVT